MPQRRAATSSCAGYTGFRTVECFQVPYQWKWAGQCIGAVLLICGVAVLACGVRLVFADYGRCGATCPPALAMGHVTATLAAVDVSLHVLLLVGLSRCWCRCAVIVTVWTALKATAALYLLVSSTYRLHTEGAAAVLAEHLVAQVALVLCLSVAVYTLAAAAHEQRASNRVDDDDP